MNDSLMWPLVLERDKHMCVVCFLWVFAYLVINLSNCQLTSPNEQTADTFALGYVQLFYLSLKASELYLKSSIFVKTKT